MLSAYVHGHGARLLRQPSAALAGAVLILGAAAAYLGGGGDCSGGERPGAYGAFVCYAPDALVFLLPAVAAVVGGVIVATARSSGEDALYAFRGLLVRRPGVAYGVVVVGLLAYWRLAGAAVPEWLSQRADLLTQAFWKQHGAGFEISWWWTPAVIAAWTVAAVGLGQLVVRHTEVTQA